MRTRSAPTAVGQAIGDENAVLLQAAPTTQLRGRARAKDKGSFEGKSDKCKGKSKGGGKNSEGPTCWKCGGEGHIGKECPSRARSMNALSEAAGAAGAEAAQDTSSLYMSSLSLDLSALDVAVDYLIAVLMARRCALELTQELHAQ